MSNALSGTLRVHADLNLEQLTENQHRDDHR